MMDEYIEREAVLMYAKLLVHVAYSRTCAIDDKEIEKAINSIPATDVRPVVRGKWTFVGYDHGLKVCECSACKKRAYGSTEFCPNCGAYMREEG